MTVILLVMIFLLSFFVGLLLGTIFPISPKKHTKPIKLTQEKSITDFSDEYMNFLKYDGTMQ